MNKIVVGVLGLLREITVRVVIPTLVVTLCASLLYPLYLLWSSIK